MRILICKVPSILVSSEGVTGEGALWAAARALLEVINLRRAQRARAGMGKVHDAASPGSGLTSHSPRSQQR